MSNTSKFKKNDEVYHKNRKKYPFWYTVVEVQPYFRDHSLDRVWVTIGDTDMGLTFFFAYDLQTLEKEKIED